MLIQYSSFIVHQSCICFDGAVMHNKWRILYNRTSINFLLYMHSPVTNQSQAWCYKSCSNVFHGRSCALLFHVHTVRDEHLCDVLSFSVTHCNNLIFRLETRTFTIRMRLNDVTVVVVREQKVCLCLPANQHQQTDHSELKGSTSRSSGKA